MEGKGSKSDLASSHRATHPPPATVPPHLLSPASPGALLHPCPAAPDIQTGHGLLTKHRIPPPRSRPLHILSPLPAKPFLADLLYHGLSSRIPEISFSSLKTRRVLTRAGTHCLPGKQWAFRADSPASPGPGLALPCSDAYCSSQMQSPPSKAGFSSRLSSAFDFAQFTETEAEVQSGPTATQLMRRDLKPRLCTLRPGLLSFHGRLFLREVSLVQAKPSEG